MKEMAGRVALVCSMMTLSPAPGRCGDDAPSRVRLRRTREGFAVGQAVRGALQHLADQRCQAVFEDFSAVSGKTLGQVLEDQAQTGQTYLGLLFFYDGGDAAICRMPGVLAFTHPGSRVVQVCGARFKEGFETNPARMEAVIIHELLHSLGLGENPPSPSQITARVAERCLE